MKRINKRIVWDLTQMGIEWYELRDRILPFRGGGINYKLWTEQCCMPMEDVRAALDAEYSFL